MPSKEQFKHEEFCAKTLISLCGERLEFERRGNDQTEPDTIFSGENDLLGIEVTSAFFQGDANDPNAHAQKAWKFAENPTFDDQGFHEIFQGSNPYLRLEQSIKRLLEQKCSKSYQSPARVWLCIYAEREALVDLSELDAIIDGLEVPSKHSFERIFILHKLWSGEGIGYRGIELFPVFCEYRS